MRSTEQTRLGDRLRLDPRQFLRIHRSTIVNVERVREVEAFFRGEFILFLGDGTQLRRGRSYRGAV